MPGDWVGERPLYEVKANLFKGLAHPLRIRVLEVLSEAGDEVAVTTLLAETGLEPSHLSQHLSVLRRNHLVVAERRGSQVFYRLAYPQVTDLLVTARELLGQILLTNTAHLALAEALPTPADATQADAPADATAAGSRR